MRGKRTHARRGLVSEQKWLCYALTATYVSDWRLLKAEIEEGS